MLSRLSSTGLTFGNELPLHAACIEDISAEAFGPGRFARAAARVREMASHAPELSFVACLNGQVIGSVRQTPVLVGTTPALMLGPLAVRPAYKGMGVGKSLMHMAADAARNAGEAFIFLVGDRGYYMPLGYEPTRPGSIVMPGPVDPMRVLVLPLDGGAVETLEGKVTARFR